ncbi:hypothetical protein [Pseudomonas sp. SCB32]|uniref:hypothetical protein n=1 Tax=Pseudomonas sp. SCB32 TaxID=2653853 RepID=UPI0012659A87|nr:hypothetical protein [Pseudomonas sp. SCB32]
MSASRFVFLPLAAALLVGCQSQADQPLNTEYDRTETVAKGVPGNAVTETEELRATVSAIDTAKRTFTLKDEQGNSRTIQAPPEMRNFNQLKVGDRVKAVVVLERIVYLRKPGEAAVDGAASLLATSRLGDKPAMVSADTVEVTTVIKSIDTAKRTATLQFADGNQDTVKVRPDVEMKPEYVGHQVVLRITSAVAVSVEPQ